MKRERNLKVMKRGGVAFFVVLAFVAGLLVFDSCAMKPKVKKIGVLCGLSFFAKTIDGFKQKMTDLGYIEGTNVQYDVQQVNMDFSGYETVLKKFVEDKDDLIFTFPTEPVEVAKKIVQGTKIPVIFADSSVETGLVNSMKEPGGNLSGVRYPATEFAIKRYEIMKQIAPKAKRYLVAYLDGVPLVGPTLKALKPIAEKDGITIIELPAKSPADIKADLDKRSKSKDTGVDAILIIPEPLTATPDTIAIMGKFAYDHKIPLGGAFVIAGDYATLYGVSLEDVSVGKQAAVMADKVLKGTAVGTIPVETPEYYIQYNYKMAQKMGINIPEALLTEANEVLK